ncbi:MAG: hypothetical protein LUE65_01260 [Clostridiales bacterium]|nr:hypothetical protein [Clostridiales bacterium]
MYKVIKNKGNMINAYQLGSGNPVIKALMDDGKIKDIGSGRYEIYSQEAINGAVGGEMAEAGDWIKVDSRECPYPNNREYFEANHRHIEGDIFEQIPKTLSAWDAKLAMCPEIAFLIENKGLIIDKTSSDRRYIAKLWGTTEAAAEDAMIVFYSIFYDEAGNVTDCDYNFVKREEFDRTYSIIIG